MKTLLTMMLFVIATLTASDFAKEYAYETSYAKALQQAKAENKDLMLVVITDYCPWCRKMERKTLSNTKINTAIHKQYVPVIVDRNHDKERFPAMYQTPRIPTIFFIDAKSEKHYWESIGFKNKKEFAKILEEAPSNK